MCWACAGLLGWWTFLPQFLQEANIQEKDLAFETPGLGTVSAVQPHTCLTCQGGTVVLRVVRGQCKQGS